MEATKPGLDVWPADQDNETLAHMMVRFHHITSSPHLAVCELYFHATKSPTGAILPSSRSVAAIDKFTEECRFPRPGAPGPEQLGSRAELPAFCVKH
jgi:hypothetical protein